jgi:hypothetical protein
MYFSFNYLSFRYFKLVGILSFRDFQFFGILSVRDFEIRDYVGDPFAGSPWPLVAGKSPSTISLKLLVLDFRTWKVPAKVTQFDKSALKANPDPEG